MSFCINPHCPKPKSITESRYCQSCGSDLLLNGKYRVTNLLSAKGGFGNTYEVIDEHKMPKVLKVLTYDSSKAIDLFQQEANLLKQLNHPGIPKGENYFIYHPRESQTALHCLVMEKIAGIDLEEYQKQRGFKPIDYHLALDWLTQLANILHEVHKHKFYHRDIKPSNIILKPDGQLVLIDFGAARQVTKTVLAGGKNTGIYTPGYAPPEQSRGHSVPQSDFYALGKTFVFLLTGKEPSDPKIYNINTNEFNWRKYASNIPSRLADFIDNLMAEKPIDRPKDTKTLLKIIIDIKTNLHQTKKTKNSPPEKTQVILIRNSASIPDLLSSSYAGFWLRFKASLIDSFIVLIIAALLGGYICFRLQQWSTFQDLNLNFDIPKEIWVYYAAGLSAAGTTIFGFALFIAAIIYNIQAKINFTHEHIAILTALGLGIVIKWLYYVFLEYLFKATIGKMFFDLSVTDSQGRRISFARANRRYLLKFLSTAPLYLGFLLAAWTKKKRTIHDMIAGTQIRKKK
ncbi:serine/threonine protein kinase [Microcystis aeruginosa NIES-2549]|uniref:Serine/threonine protein kinase n=1 Tax=Microcystis aeruginosa NIES-2549 TaxID=1641812 RepID=A0A0F6U4I6_MICAE|nr:RDD family protein [Microcystis aeruginosa]AKE64302.1 serine/threonine protein kinase [Microcystis aeruginosa NIES-2549]AOC52698.1 serine/threonine protein kinase [Microcystis aeruginosa NIES-2481]